MKSDQLKTLLELFDMWFIRRYPVPNCQKLKTMVKRRKRSENFDDETFDARHGRIESEAVVKSYKGLSGVEGGKGNLLPVERKKASVRKETVAVSATKPKIVRKNQNTLPPAPSEPTASRGRSGVKEEKYPRQKSPWVHFSTTVQILFERYLYANVL